MKVCVTKIHVSYFENDWDVTTCQKYLLRRTEIKASTCICYPCLVFARFTKRSQFDIEKQRHFVTDVVSSTEMCVLCQLWLRETCKYRVGTNPTLLYYGCDIIKSENLTMLDLYFFWRKTMGTIVNIVNKELICWWLGNILYYDITGWLNCSINPWKPKRDCLLDLHEKQLHVSSSCSYGFAKR